MRGTEIEKTVEICATNLTNKIECTSTHATKWENFCEDMFMVSIKFQSRVFRFYSTDDTGGITTCLVPDD
jgi:hypothetical protein